MTRPFRASAAQIKHFLFVVGKGSATARKYDLKLAMNALQLLLRSNTQTLNLSLMGGVPLDAWQPYKGKSMRVTSNTCVRRPCYCCCVLLNMRWCVLPVRAQLKLAYCRHCNTTEFQDLTQQQIDSWFDDHNSKVQQCP